MNISNYNDSLFAFLTTSPTPFHAVQSMKSLLKERGFSCLSEKDTWEPVTGQPYLITREDGAIIAFTLGTEETKTDGFRMLCSHTDSPCLQIKPQPDIRKGSFLQLGVEVYGGALLHPWFDRDLSLAGRICVEKEDGRLEMVLIDFQRPLLTIPSLAIHFDREANKEHTIDRQAHLSPLLSQSVRNRLPDFRTLLMEQARNEYPEMDIREILAFDLFCYDVQTPSYVGADGEFISASRLDNLLSCHAGALAIIAGDRRNNTLLYCANHEENGSTSSAGAHGSFFDSVLERLLPDPEQRRICLHNSFLVSVDNAHAVHPNFSDKSDGQHDIHLNSGPVIKINSNQRYATSSASNGIFKRICEDAEIEPQSFVMRNDMACGSTIGPMTAARLGIRTVDVGAASLAMHSIREHTGYKDPYLMFRAVRQFLNSDFHKDLIE